jgi:hypothetical protein
MKKPIVNECPKCHGLLEDDGSCSCGYGKKRRSEAKVSSGPELCAWFDQGRRCVCRGILSASTQGGQLYCREHWERANHREPDVVGNALPATRGESLAAKHWHAKMAAHKAAGGHSSLDRKGKGKPDPTSLEMPYDSFP